MQRQNEDTCAAMRHILNRHKASSKPTGRKVQLNLSFTHIDPPDSPLFHSGNRHLGAEDIGCGEMIGSKSPSIWISEGSARIHDHRQVLSKSTSISISVNRIEIKRN
jgi:hypothetical protein